MITVHWADQIYLAIVSVSSGYARLYSISHFGFSLVALGSTRSECLGSGYKHFSLETNPSSRVTVFTVASVNARKSSTIVPMNIESRTGRKRSGSL